MNEILTTQQELSWEDVKKAILATSEQMKETDRKMKEMEYRFFSQAGHIIEGLMEPSAIKMFQEKGYDIDCCYKNFKKFNKTCYLDNP